MAAEKKVLLALSGGVDSAACALLLRRMGFEVHGLVLRFSPAHDAAVAAAQRTAHELGIALTVGHCEADFEKQVITPFCDAYATGKTPNPCVVCNPLVKFHHLVQHADYLGIEAVATGHYARVVFKAGAHHVAVAKSAARDQSYMLYRLPQSVLSRLVLPAGELEKQNIRGIAAEAALSSAGAPDSQEICFVLDGDYATFIERRGLLGQPGRFIGPAGEDLGPHRGILHYTVGQRRGIGVAYCEPLYVRRIFPGGNIQLATASGMTVSRMALTQYFSSSGTPPLYNHAYEVKVRSVAKPAACHLEFGSEKETLLVFKQPQRAPAPGQHAVLYENGLVVGGGVMDWPADGQS